MADRIRIEELDGQLVTARSAADRRSQLLRLQGAAQADRAEVETALQAQKRSLAREQGDVTTLQEFSLTSLFYRMLGQLDEKIADEEKQLLLAALHHQLAAAELVFVDAQLEEIARQLPEFEGAEIQLQNLRAKKEEWLADLDGPAAAALFQMSEESGRQRALLRELSEAIEHGTKVLSLMTEVTTLLRGAGIWGTFDMFGGGILATFVKHGKIYSAKQKVAEAQAALLEFQRELGDVEMQLGVEIEIHSFTVVGDYFFDDVLFSSMVQGNISQALTSARSAKSAVETAARKVAQQRARLAEQIEEDEAQRNHFIEGWRE